jgi:ferredoxin-NADP reductase/MOSC domain-containing protein YiiM
MRLLNFSVGKVQAVQIGSESIRTAHVKKPIPEPWTITDEGAEGDQRAVHPDKIYAYARTHYEYWGTYLGVDPAQWPDGFFGENLTFDALDEEELRVGDVFALGEEVRLVVAGPRNPCLKLSWRLGQPQTFQKIFQRSRHTGVYFGVLAAGRVRPGDRAVRIQRRRELATLAETADFAAGHATPPLEPLRRLLDFEHLSKTMRFILTAKVDGAERAAATSAGRWRGWRTFVIARIEEEAPEIRSFYLRPEDGQPLCQSRPGQFVTVQMSGADGENMTRCWSLSAFSHSMQDYRLTVRRQGGSGSNWLHRASVGTTLKLRAPAGEFVLDGGSFRPVVLIAAGIGITPLLAMLHAHLARGNAGAPVYLIYGARTPAQVAFRRELEVLADAHPRLTIHYVYSDSDAAGRPAGRITPDLVVSLLRDLHVMLGERRIALPWYENDTYLCGPGEFCVGLKKAFVARGANPDHMFFELFSANLVQETLIDCAEVRFQRSGVSCTWRAEEDLTLLELAEKAGVDVASDCRAGACLTCKTAVVEGVVTSDMGDGSALLCIGRPRTSRLTLDR